MSRTIVLSSAELIPDAWVDAACAGPVRAFNPGLLREGTGWVLAYRVVLSDLKRRLAVCRLGPDFTIVPRSAVELTDLVHFRLGHQYSETAMHWFADPRLFRLGSRVFMYWNSGWHSEPNNQFLQELDGDSLRPIGSPRAVVLRGKRQVIEKNWTFFGSGPMYVVYSISPHRVLSVDLEGDGDVVCQPLEEIDWDNTAYATRYGWLRGGAPPQRMDDGYYSFCHSVVGGQPPYRYVPAVYRFSATPPFGPTHAPALPLALDNPFGDRTVHARLNAAVGEVCYPAGASHVADQWIISYGINDEHCALGFIADTELARFTRPLTPP